MIEGKAELEIIDEDLNNLRIKNHSGLSIDEVDKYLYRIQTKVCRLIDKTQDSKPEKQQ